MADDSLAAAKAQQEVFQDNRVQHYWDPERILGKIVAEPLLKNTPIAWDIYLLFNPGTHWENEIFPAPDFWMHQLPEDESLRLDPEILQQQVFTVINNFSKSRI